MKYISKAIVAAASLLLAAATNSLAIEGLQISVQCPDIVLGWPSTPGENFIIQWRPTLDPSTNWVTLTDYYPADWTTNWTIYVHSNQAQCTTGGASNLSGDVDGLPPTPSIASTLASTALLSEPLAMPADGSGSAVPLCLYPPGMDMSRFIILDPSTGQWVSGAGYARSLPTLSPATQFDGPQPSDDGPGGGDPPATGFYRVVRDGVHIVGMTNDMTLSGSVTFPVEVGNATGNLVSLSLTEDGTPVNGSSAQTPPFQSPLQLTADTTMMNNGVHQFSGSARWEDENGASYEADSDPIQVNIQNEISFPNWMPYFGEGGDTLLISAQSAHPDTDWWIDIYGANAGHIGTFAGHTYDGNIYGWWDLRGPDGVQHTDEPWFQFEVSTWYADPPTPKSYRITDPWPGPGEWTIVAQHAWDNLLGNEELYAELDGFIGMAQGVGWAVRPTLQEGHAFGLHFKDPNEPSDWASFRQALFHPNCRNLIYFGHGGPNGFGYNQSSTNTSICVPEISARLATIPAALTNRHAFRLVIADGCSTAKGKLPEAFGIIHKEGVPSIDYANASMRMSAFVGWSSDKWIGTMGSVNFDHVNFIIYLQQEMALGGATISQAAYNAAHKPNIGYINTSELKIFGCGDVTFGSQNR